MRAVFSPSAASGSTAAPPSKSMAHRLLILAGLSRGESVIHGVSPSDDLLATLDCLEALGAAYSLRDGTARITGTDAARRSSALLLPCRESGSTLRFLLPVALTTGTRTVMTGSGRLFCRPLEVYEELCRAAGAEFERGDGQLTLSGRLRPGEYEFSGGVSSQFTSGLLLALPLLDHASRIRLLPPVVSRPYIDMTMQALGLFGAHAHWEDETSIAIPGAQRYSPCEASVEGDHSNAAFLDALNLMGGSVTLTGLPAHSLQGDRVYREHFASLQNGFTRIDLTHCPDLAPVLFAIAAKLHGGEFYGTHRLAAKESDRGGAMAAELIKLGANAIVRHDSITIEPGRLAARGPLSSHNDHRIAMALSVLLSATGGELTGAEAVNKSFPDFFLKLRGLGIDVELS